MDVKKKCKDISARDDNKGRNREKGEFEEQTRERGIDESYYFHCKKSKID